MKRYTLYVDGQLGLPFDNLEDARKAAKVFEESGFEALIIDDQEPL